MLLLLRHTTPHPPPLSPSCSSTLSTLRPRYYMEAVKDIRDDWPAAMAQQQRPSAKQARLDVGLGDTMEEIDSIGVRIGFINDLLQEVRGVAGSCWRQQGPGMGHTCSLHAARRMVEQMGVLEAVGALGTVTGQGWEEPRPAHPHASAAGGMLAEPPLVGTSQLCRMPPTPSLHQWCVAPLTMPCDLPCVGCRRPFWRAAPSPSRPPGRGMCGCCARSSCPGRSTMRRWGCPASWSCMMARTPRPWPGSRPCRA